MSGVKVKGADNAQTDIYVDTIGAGATQVVKIQLGNSGADGGLLSSDNPLPITDANLQSVIKEEDTQHTSGDKGFPIFGIRASLDAVTADNDGDYTLMKMDEEGRLKVATKPASIITVEGTATAIGNTIVCDVRRASNVVFHAKNTGTVTLAAGTFVFEASIDSTNGTDGTWFGIQAVRSNANTVETSIALSGIAASAGYAASWEASVNAYQWFRIRCTVAVTASAIAKWTVQRGSYATEPIPAVQSHAVTLSSTSVSVTTHTPTTYNDSVTNLAISATFTGTSRDAGATNTMRKFCAYAYADQAGTLAIDVSNDNTAWRRIKTIAVAAGSASELELNVCIRYHRVVYINGAVAQGAFMLNSSYHRV